MVIGYWSSHEVLMSMLFEVQLQLLQLLILFKDLFEIYVRMLMIDVAIGVGNACDLELWVVARAICWILFLFLASLAKDIVGGHKFSRLLHWLDQERQEILLHLNTMLLIFCGCVSCQPVQWGALGNLSFCIGTSHSRVLPIHVTYRLYGVSTHCLMLTSAGHYRPVHLLQHGFKQTLLPPHSFALLTCWRWFHAERA